MGLGTVISGHLPSRGSGIRVAGGQGFGWTARPGPRGGSLGFPAGPAGVAPRRPSFRWGIPGGVPATGAGRGGAGAGPITAYKRERAPALATSLRALSGQWYDGPRPPARATVAPRGRPCRRRRVGGSWEIPGGADWCLLCSWDPAMRGQWGGGCAAPS